MNVMRFKKTYFIILGITILTKVLKISRNQFLTDGLKNGITRP